MVSRQPSRWLSAGLTTGACVLFLGLVHVLLLGWMRQERSTLGALTDRFLVPLHAEWDPQLTVWAVPAVLVLLTFLLLVPSLLRTRPGVTMLAGVASFVAITTSVSMIDGIVSYGDETHAAIVMPLARTHLEYYGDVPLVEDVGGARSFIWKYAKPRLFQQLSLHSKTHPPGGAVFLWMVSKIVGKGPWTAALSMIAFSSLAAALVLLISKELYGERVGRAAMILFLVTPSTVMYGATSMDSVFAVPAMLSLLFFLRSQRPDADRKRCALWGSLSGLTLAAASFMTYAVVFLPVFFLVLLLHPEKKRFRLSRMILGHACGLVCFVGFYGALFAWTEYNPFEAVAASMARDAAMVGTGHESLSAYIVISLSNMVAFAAGVGFPTMALWVLATVRSAGWRQDEAARAFVWSWTLVAFSTLFTLEVERIWLFMVPLVVAPAARWLVEISPERSDRGLHLGAAALAVNTLADELLFNIGW